MALAKAFMCQVVLFGLYKLFLEQIVEDHLVPDELTRNCLVGFVCLLCFGIQLYTEKADEDYEDEEDLKRKSKLKNTTAEVSASRKNSTESIGRSSLDEVSFKKAQNGLHETVPEKKISSKNPTVSDFRENDSSPLSTEEQVKQVQYSSILTNFSTNTTDENGNDTKERDIGKLNAVASNIHNTKSIQKLSGFIEMEVCEESDKDGIEIDHLVTKESPKDQDKFGAVETEEVKLKDASDTEEVVILNENEKFAAVHTNMTEKDDSVNLKDLTEIEEVELVNQNVTEAEEAKEVGPSVTEVGPSVTEAEEVGPSVAEVEEVAAANQDVAQAEQTRTVEASKLEHVTASLESENMKSDGQNIQSFQNFDINATLAIDESVVKIANGTIVDSFSNIARISSNTIEPTDAILSVRNTDEIGVEQEMNSSSETEECLKDIVNTLPSTQETNGTIPAKEVEAVDKCNVETSTQVKSTVSSPSQESRVQSSRRRISTEDVCVAPLTIDISFIYACH